LNKEIKKFEDEHGFKVNEITANEVTKQMLKKKGVDNYIKINENLINGLLFLDSIDINKKSRGIRKKIVILYL
jgi:hypothetical protein